MACLVFYSTCVGGRQLSVTSENNRLCDVCSHAKASLWQPAHDKGCVVTHQWNSVGPFSHPAQKETAYMVCADNATMASDANETMANKRATGKSRKRVQQLRWIIQA